MLFSHRAGRPQNVRSWRFLTRREGAVSGVTPRLDRPLEDGDGIDWHSDPALEQERAESEEELVRPILGQIVEVEDLHDVGASVPDEIDVQRQPEKAERLSVIIGFHREAPFHRRVVRPDRDDLHVVQELQAIGADAWLWLMPLGVRRVETPGIIGFSPRLPPARPHQQNVSLSDLDVLPLRGVLQILGGDPIIDRENVSALVPGNVEQHSSPDHLDDARRITLRGTQRLWRRHVVVQSVLAVDMPEGVEMRTGMVVHEGEAGGTLLALWIEVP